MLISTSVSQKVRDNLYEMRDGEDGLEKFAKFFLTASFRKPFNAHRRDLARRISDTGVPRQWHEGSRGIGKTTLTWAECIRRICFRLTSFMVYTSSEVHLAERRTESIKSALLNTPKIRQFFGDFSPQYVDGMREVFGTKSWKLTDPLSNEAFFVCVPKSDGTTVNGLLEWVCGRQQRPDLILCDDMTDRLRVWDETYRSNHKEWAFGTLFPCVDNDYQPNPVTKRWDGVCRGERPPWQILVLDTCKHSDAFVENVAVDPDWVGRRYPLAEEVSPGKFRSLVENLSDEQVQSIYEQYARLGKEDRFYKEFLCISGHATDERFPRTFQYYSEADVNLNGPEIVRMIIMDPARTRNPKSCFTAILAVAVDLAHSRVWLRRSINARLSQEEMIKALFDLADETHTDILAVEDAGLNDHITGPLQRYAMQTGHYVHWELLPTQRKFVEAEGEHRDIKECRASSALWLYRALGDTHPNGCVWHEESIRHSDLEQQMLGYPECKYWDALDTLGHLDYLMRKMGLVFQKQEVAVHEQKRSTADEWEEVIEGRTWCYEGMVA